MGVQLNIKDAETVELARKLADATGQSVTAAIKSALRREMDVRDAEIATKIARMNAAVDEFRKHLPPDWEGKTSREIVDSIYDEDGLPI